MVFLRLTLTHNPTPCRSPYPVSCPRYGHRPVPLPSSSPSPPPGPRRRLLRRPPCPLPRRRPAPTLIVPPPRPTLGHLPCRRRTRRRGRSPVAVVAAVPSAAPIVQGTVKFATRAPPAPSSQLPRRRAWPPPVAPCPPSTALAMENSLIRIRSRSNRRRPRIFIGDASARTSGTPGLYLYGNDMKQRITPVEDQKEVSWVQIEQEVSWV